MILNKADFQIQPITKEKALSLYHQLLMPRLIEEKMLNLLRQGKISKWFSGIGQEAISVGCTAALQEDEVIFTMHRNLGVFTTREVDLMQLFCQWQGKLPGFTQGRDRSFHFGTMDHHIVGMISHLGPQMSLANGIALAHQLSGEQKLSLAFTGEGGTSQGEFHEAINIASVWNLPVLFVIENNGYGLSTPTREQYNCRHLADRGVGYGIEAHIIDGNDIMEVYQRVSEIAADIRQHPRPVLLECKTFRMRGHEEASGTKYVPSELFEEWAQKDPILRLEKQLLEASWITQEEITAIKGQLKEKITAQWQEADEYPDIEAQLQKETGEVFMDFDSPQSDIGTTKNMRFVDAVSDGLYKSMELHENLILMGQDIAEYGGVFKITEGFIDAFGKERVRNTPLCESGIIGCALGLSLMNYKSMVEMQFADFVSCGFNQIVNNLAKLHYRWGENADVVIRMPTGGTVGAGPFHSQSNEAWFFHTPGLKIVYPSNPADAKGLLMTAISDPNPVLYFEHKALYRKINGEVPEGYYFIPFGQSNIIMEGADLSIITYGLGVHWAMEAAQKKDASIEILDLRSLRPLDYNGIINTVKKTNRVLILHEDNLIGGIGAEISAYISEHLFDYLDAPIKRLGGLDTPIPFNPVLENQYMPESRLDKTIDQLLNY